MPKYKRGDFTPHDEQIRTAEEAEALTLSTSVKDGVRYTVLKPKPAVGCEFAETWKKIPMGARGLY